MEDHHLNESTSKKDIISNAVYFKDIPNAKELNKYLFKEIKKWRKVDPEGEKKQPVLAGIVKQIWIKEKNTNLLLMNYLEWLTSVTKILVLGKLDLVRG